MRRLMAAAALAAALVANPLPGQVARLSADQVEIGRPVQMDIQLPGAAPGATFELVIPEEQRPMFRLSPPRAVGEDALALTVRPIRSGQLTLGPVTLKVTPTTGTPYELQLAPMAIAVSAPAGEMQPELRDFTAPREEPFDYTWRNLILGAAGLVGAGLMAVAFVLGRRWWRRRAERLAWRPPVPPIDQALAALRELKTMDAFHAGGPNRHYTELSMALRRYLEAEYHWPAAEMTEDEVCDRMAASMPMGPEEQAVVRALRRSSMAKFARREPTLDEARLDCLSVEAFLLMEKERLAVRAAEAGAPAPGGSAA
jgi:hypothetical protein